MACEFEKACLKWIMSDCTMEPELCDYAKFAHEVRTATLGDPESAVSKWIRDYLNSEEHREQYAKRVDLNKKIEELIVERNVSHILVSGNDVNRVIRAVQNIIQNHGLEE